MPASSRLSGPDTLRASAIVLVFVYHYRIFVSRQPELGWLAEVGWSGVDLFFVLSGYLIAEPLLRGLRQGQEIALGAYYARRASRTWPLFWLVVAAFFVLPGQLGGREPPPLWRFLTFTQNIGLQPGTAFSHAWSLCIEEQFYLFLPLAVIAAQRLRLSKTLAWCGLIGLTLAACVWRSWLWQHYGAEDQVVGYYQNIYYASLGRMDEFLPGVALALLRHGSPRLWARCMDQGQVLLMAGLALVALMWALICQGYYIPGQGYGFFMSGPGYSLMAWAYALLLMAALSPRSGLGRVRVPGARSLALWSYAIYLTHKPLAHVLKPLTAAWNPWLQFAFIAAACVLLGALLYLGVERPIMRWRERRWPTQMQTGGAPANAQVA